MQTLLACMPGVGTGPETHYFSRILPYLEQVAQPSFTDIQQAITSIMFGDQSTDLDWDDLADAFKQHDHPGLFVALLSQMGQRTQSELKLLLEKTPAHLRYIDELIETFPSARFIVLLRDPRAIATSMLGYLPDLTQQERYSYLAKQARYVLDAFNSAHAALARHPGQTRLIYFEQLLDNRDAALGELCEFLRLSFEPVSADRFEAVAQAIVLPHEAHKANNSRLDHQPDLLAWRKKLSLAEAIFLESLLIERLTGWPYRWMTLPRRLLRVLRQPLLNWAKQLPEWQSMRMAQDTLLDQYRPWSPSTH
ncbi:MAG: sulfotransferase [Chloroflexi bacterium]|nr:sulfotransferase [Chloroflexota bacterium]